MAIGASRAGIVRLFVFESLLVSRHRRNRSAPLLAWQLVPLVPKMAVEFSSVRCQHTQSTSRFPCSASQLRLSILTGLLMGIYPALQSSRGDLVDGLEGRRPRNERQRATTALPQNSRRRASRALGDAACWRGVVDHEFCTSESAKSRLPATEIFGLVSSLCRRHNILISRRVSVSSNELLASLRDGSRFRERHC